MNQKILLNFIEVLMKKFTLLLFSNNSNLNFFSIIDQFFNSYKSDRSLLGFKFEESN